MKTLGNIIWHFPFFGFVTAFLNLLFGVLLIVTVIAAPIGLGLVQLAKFQLSPFSSAMVTSSELGNEENKYWKSFGIVVTILYLPFGLLIALLTVIQIALLFVSIIGIPVALVLSKSLSTYFNPVGKVCVPASVANEIEKRNTTKDVEAFLKNKQG
jgi:uncharacterized membrane protein YccF (DUF307 family)